MKPQESAQNKARAKIQSKALEVITPRNQAGIDVSMRVGKCYIGLQDMEQRYHETVKFLIVAPKKVIFDSWRTDAQQFGLEYLLDHITFSTYKSLPKQTHDYDTVYLDECHSLKFTHGDWLSIYQNHYQGRTIGLTGTYPENKRSEKYKMCIRFCPNVYTYTTDDAVRDGILNDYRIVVHAINLDTRMNIKMQPKGSNKPWMTSEVKQYEYWTEMVDNATGDERMRLSIQRMKVLQSFSGKTEYVRYLLSQMNTKTLIFANTQNQADELSKHSFHSKNKRSDENLELFRKGGCMFLSCVDQLSEGVKIDELKSSIIMHSYGNNRRAAQRIGRTLGLSPEQVGTIHILCYYNSVDKTWVDKSLNSFNQEKITWTFPQESQWRNG